jgi:hypothetical protein
MSATDPHREALTAKLAEMELFDNTGHPYDEGYMAAWREFKAALAAVPAEPEYDAADDTTEVPCGMCRATGIDQQSDATIILATACPWCDGTKTTLALGHWVRPAEPEAWEYRTMAHWVLGSVQERRRPGTAPGPWKRVDPEPQPQEPPRRPEPDLMKALKASLDAVRTREPRPQDGGEQ